MVNMNNNNFVIISLILIAVAVTSVWMFGDTFKTVEDSSEFKYDEWKTFTSEEFSFSIKCPEDWQYSIDTERPFAPMFSFFIPNDDIGDDGPFDHHYVGIDHVSVYPYGIPTEGVFGQTISVSEDWRSDITRESSLYVLEDNTPFAAYLRFEQVPESWEDWGFVWVRSIVEDEQVVYLVDGEEVDRLVDPLGDPRVEVVRRGEVNKDAWNILRKVVESIEFKF